MKSLVVCVVENWISIRQLVPVLFRVFKLPAGLKDVFRISLG